MGEETTTIEEATHQAQALSPMGRDELIERYEKLVYKVAHGIQRNLPEEVDIEDLIGWGYMGLLEAYERYDETKSTRFATYAYYRVRGAILDACPDPILDSRRRLADTGSNEVLNTYAHVVNSHRAQASLEDRLSQLSDVAGSLQMVYVLRDAPEVAFRPNGAPQARRLNRIDNAQAIRQAVEGLPDREKKVLEAMYFEGRSMTDIGESMGYSPSWVSRIHSRALERLGDRISGDEELADLQHMIPV